MSGKCFLEMTAEVVGAGEDAGGGAKGEKAVGVDLFEADRKFFGGGANHLRKEKTGEIVCNNNCGMGGERFEEAASLPCGGFYIRIVGDFVFCSSEIAVGHAVDDEAMKAVASPLVAAAERFEYQERFVESAGMFEGTVEREIVGETAGGDHPVEDVLSSGTDGCVVTLTNADGRNRGQRRLPEFFAESALGRD